VAAARPAFSGTIASAPNQERPADATGRRQSFEAARSSMPLIEGLTASGHPEIGVRIRLRGGWQPTARTGVRSANVSMRAAGKKVESRVPGPSVHPAQERFAR